MAVEGVPGAVAAEAPVQAAQVPQVPRVVAVTPGAVATVAARGMAVEWGMASALASAPPTLRTLFQHIAVNRSLRDTKEQITMAEASRPTVAPATLQSRVTRSRITTASSVLRLARKLFRPASN